MVRQERVAITGLGVVSPVGVGCKPFWSALAAGTSGIAGITRFDCSTFAVRIAGEVKQDLALPEEVSVTAARDPKVGFGFAAAAEALARAGASAIPAEALLHLGVSLEVFDLGRAVIDGRLDLQQLACLCLQGDQPPLQIPLDTCTQLVAGHFGRPARMLTNCSACAAGAQAIGHGFTEVRAGRCPLALCGGLDSMINPLGVGGFQLLGALTTDNERGASACRPFDAARSGTVLGEGAAVVVLEPLSRVRAEGRPVLAEICGYGSSLDAYSLSAPDSDGDGAARAMRAALDDAGLDPAAIGHINSHGTATELNDQVEAQAIRRVFDGCWEQIPVSATKSVTGHLIAAAGAVELAAAVLPLVHGVLPPNPCLERIGPGCELNHVTAPGIAFNGEYVLSSSFGFGGQNAAIILRGGDGD
jgi:3-oxoacyl-[acyl-carrier-protein] synthase II